MIDGCFRHIRGVGPGTEAALRERGFLTWDECMKRNADLPMGGGRRRSFLEALSESRDLLDNDDIGALVALFPVSEQWRLLAAYLRRATFLDCEPGCQEIQAMFPSAAYHGGTVRTFLYGENEDFPNFR